MVKFKTDPGPRLLVYLTTRVGSNDFISLGILKGTSGNFTYDVPANTDLTKYKIVDIWCIDFSQSFGHAVLKQSSFNTNNEIYLVENYKIIKNYKK